jgi:hypothetical protein
MRNKIVLLLMLVISLGLEAQVGLSGGISSVKGFGVPKPYMGLHLGVEIPRDDAISFYGRATFSLPNRGDFEGLTYATAIDMTTTPYLQQITYNDKMNYTILEGGSRHYIGDGYDAGFGAYGGTNLSILFNKVSRDYSEFDRSKYQLDANQNMESGSIFNLGLGLTGGVKNTFAGIGTLYFDVNVSYLIISLPSNSLAQQGELYTPLLFNFALGFRKELY